MKIPSRTGVTAGVTAASPPERAIGRSRKAIVAGLVATGLVSSSLLMPGFAAAAVPTAPNNLVVFPDRDFITIEGYSDKAGQTATVEVSRGTTVMGSAASVISGGEVAFEINHPGGACWGAGTNLAVTPDIKAGDKVTIKFADGTSDDTTVQDAAVNAKTSLNGTTLTVTGRIAAGVNQAQVEQRIVNPDLTDTDIGRRDIRALPGPLTPSDKGGYSSGLSFNGETFTATYTFDTLETAQIAAAGGGERFMAWQTEDTEANRQGLTISEFGEAGGPGMGGCPAGPGDVAAPKPGEASVVRSADKKTLQVGWAPAAAQPGAAVVTGYSVEAIDPAGNVVGKRLAAADTKATLTVDAALDYKVEVRSLTEDGALSKAFTATAGGGTGTPTAPPTNVDATPPTLTLDTPADQATTAVKLTSDGQIFYTTDGSPASNVDMPADNAVLYNKTTGIQVPAGGITLNAVAFDDAGNKTVLEPGNVKFGAAPVAPLAKPVVTATPGQGSVKLDWAAVDGATSYKVAVTPTPAAGQPAATELRTQTISGLTAGTTYSFTVTASRGTETSTSDPATATPAAVTAAVTITSARWKSGDMRIVGTTSAAPTNPSGNTVRFYKADAAGKAVTTQPVGGTQNQTLTAPVAPSVNSTFDVRYRTTATTGTTNPGRIVAVVADSAGKVLGTSPVFTATNG